MFDYNQTPFTLLGTKAFTHERPKQRQTWAYHGKIGYVIGSSMHKYQHLEFFYIPETRGKYDTDTYVFLPTKFELPTEATANCATLSLEEFTKALEEDAQLTFTSKSVNTAIKALRNIIVPNGTDKENISLPMVNLELSKQNVSPSRVEEAND